MIYILITTGLLIAIAEIIIDKKIWKASGNDKPRTTIARLVLISIVATFMPLDMFLWNYLVMLMTFFLVFDFGLNISRWKAIKGIFYYRPYHEIYRDYIKRGFTHFQSHNSTIIRLSEKQEAIFHLMNFISKLFYHGSDKPKWSYDWLYQRIPPVMELMIKGICFGVAVYLYFN